MRRGGWQGWSLDLMTGHGALPASSSGIVGAGRIGRAVAAKAAAFGMTRRVRATAPATVVDGHPAPSFDAVARSSPTSSRSTCRSRPTRAT